MRLQPRVVIVAIACLLALPGSALGATFTVNSNADAPDLNPGNGVCAIPSAGPPPCTLRAAVQEASSFAGNDTIILPAGVYRLTVAGADEDAAAQGDLDLGLLAANVPDSIDIVGAGARATQISQTTGDRVLDLVSGVTTANISGVTISGGTGGADGGGILAQGPITLTDVAITGNQVSGASSRGGGLEALTSNTLTNVTIAGNVATATDGTAEGGGMYALSGLSTLTNVTIAGNSAGDDDPTNSNSGEGSGLWTPASGLTAHLQNVTIAGNTITGTSTGGGGLFADSTPSPNPNLSIANTIVALNTNQDGTASNCNGVAAGASDGYNLESARDCGFASTGDKPAVDPLLGPLQNNGGPTDTRALLGGSPPLDAGNNVGCPATDQRGFARPFNGTCDIGAFEFVPAPILPPPPAAAAEVPDPVLGKTVNVGPVSGKVFYAIPPKSSSITSATSSQIKGLKFKPLKKARQLPVRSFLNTRKGTVRLTSARPKKGATQTGTFTSGLFQVLQSRKKKAKGITELRLKGSSFKRCAPRKRGKPAQAALSKRRIRRLRSNAKGRFRTRGRYGAATVRGTKWLTADRCDGTLVKVTRGKVAVRDFRRRKTIVVKRGERYLAKARVR